MGLVYITKYNTE